MPNLKHFFSSHSKRRIVAGFHTHPSSDMSDFSEEYRHSIHPSGKDRQMTRIGLPNMLFVADRGEPALYVTFLVNGKEEISKWLPILEKH